MGAPNRDAAAPAAAAPRRVWTPAQIAARNALWRARNPRQSVVAARAGGVIIDTASVAAAQLADADHDVVAAAVQLAERSGAQLYGVPLQQLRRARAAVSATPSDGATAALADAIAGVEAAIDSDTASPEETAARVQRFREYLCHSADLPACGSCGMRAVPSTVGDYVRRDVASLVPTLAFSAEAKATRERIPQAYRAVSSAYHLPGPDGGTLLHLHPELVSDGEGTAASTMLCGRCVAAVNRGKKPPLSLAAGHDYGVLRRVLDAGDAVVSIAEQLAESLVRAYPCIVKLSAAQAGTVASVGLVGHVICFPHDAAEVVVATKPLLAEGGGCRPSRSAWWGRSGCTTCCGARGKPIPTCSSTPTR